MEASSIVVSLDMAKKLAQSGWPQDEKPYFSFDPNGQLSHMHSFPCGSARDGRCEFLAAPTASELIRKIPVEMRGMVSKEKLDDPNEWAKCYCDIQPTNIRLS